jgi:localization factor PodJL
MKSGGPWNLRGLRPEAREAAREAARRSGMSVGEWLNSVIRPDDEDDSDWSADFDREPEERWPQHRRRDEREREPYRGVERRRREREPDDQWQQSRRREEGEVESYRETDWRRRERSRDEEVPTRREGTGYREEYRGSGSPYYEEPLRYEEPRRERVSRPGRERDYVRESNDEGDARRPRYEPPVFAPHEEPPAPKARSERASPRPPENDRDAFVDQAVAEIAARQRVLDSGVGDKSPLRQPTLDTDVGAEAAAAQTAPGDDLTAQITARQRALAGETAETTFSQREPLPLSSLPPEGRPPSGGDASIQPIDLGGLEQQLRQITLRIEALRPSAELETAINAVRADLAEIGRSLTEALPRRALESLEIEIKALAQRIDHSRQSGVDTAALAGLERGLAEVREALRTLTPAESLVGFDEAVRGLAKKVDAIVARDDPATLQQLETAIGALRGIVSNVASNDTLAKVAGEVRALAAKIDDLANSAASGHALSTLENRINVLATALNASTDAGHAVPRELEKLLSGLIEKLEWVQLTHTDHTALAHLEDRIATLVKRLDASDSRLGLLEGVERGLADLLVHMEHLRGAKSEAVDLSGKPVVSDAIEQEVARTQDSLEAVQGTVEHVVDRLAMIESDIRVDRARTALTEEPWPVEAEEPPPPPPPPPPLPERLETFIPPDVSEASSDFPAEPSVEVAKQAQAEPAPRRLAVARAPIDPSLPPDHPLEPGFTAAGRSRNLPSAAMRIAASEAAIDSKPPVIPDPGGGKSDFIAAARRAARAAALATPQERSSAISGASVQPKRMADRLRTLMVAAAVVVIVVGGFHIISRFLEDGGSGSAPTAPKVTPGAPTAPPAQQTEPHGQAEPAPLDITPPHVQTETPLAPASASDTIPANPQPSPPPLSSGDSSPHPGASLSPESVESPTPPTGSAHQSQSDSSGWPPTTAAGASPNRAIGGSAPWSASDITGSLPHSPAPHSAAASPATSVADKLPVAVGSSALRTAALAGDPMAAYEVAVRLAEGRAVPQDDEAAAHWFERAAKRGLAPAQFRLASLYEKGIGVKRNLGMARDLYRAAADKGHGKAMHNLAVLYAEGIDGPGDYRTAAQWFRKAAEHGVTDSQYNLAVLYARGVGVEQDFAESFKWFFLAAREGDKDAAQKREEMAAHLDEQSLAAARIEVEKWAPLPQPADAITVKGAWDPPVNLTSGAKPKARSSVKASVPDATKTN